MLDYNRLAKLIRELRIGSGMTQEAVAEALCCCRSTYTYLEAGKTKPDLATVRQLSDVFGVPLEVFFYPEKYSGSKPPAKSRVNPGAAPGMNIRVELSREEQALISLLRAYDGLNTEKLLPKFINTLRQALSTSIDKLI